VPRSPESGAIVLRKLATHRPPLIHLKMSRKHPPPPLPPYLMIHPTSFFLDSLFMSLGRPSDCRRGAPQSVAMPTAPSSSVSDVTVRIVDGDVTLRVVGGDVMAPQWGKDRNF
jgi:hypothetical protein